MESRIKPEHLNIIKLDILQGDTMLSFEAIPKKWGNSLGITIPRDIVKKAKMKNNKKILVTVEDIDFNQDLKKVFGTLKLKRPTQEMLDESDKEMYDDL